MEIQCGCGKFRAEIKDFPRRTAGRAICYCDDCQAYLHHLKRDDLLDANGGTEIVPVYPSDLKIREGTDQLRCTRLSPTGLYRFSTNCCNSPLANVRPGFPWVGLISRGVRTSDAEGIAPQLGPVKARIMGRFAKGTPPPGTADKIGLKESWVVLPFVLKGLLLGRARPSPFFDANGEPIVRPHVLFAQEKRIPN